MENKYFKVASFDELNAAQKRRCDIQVSNDLITRSMPGSLIVLLLWICVASLVFMKDTGGEATPWLVSFSIAFIFAVGLRSYFLYLAKQNIEQTKICRFYITMGLFLSCLTWGVMAACSYLQTPLLAHQDIILFATIGLSAGGALSFSLSRFYVYIYVLCMMVPILLVEFFIAEQLIIDKVSIVIVYIVALLWVTINPSREYMQACISNLQLEEMSNTDGLTGVRNRRYFDFQLEEELQRAQRTNGSVALLIIDIDHFKDVNDEHGHIAGDACLIEVANCLQKSVKRISDTVARYGGEEFAIIIANTDDAHCLNLAEQIRHSIESISVCVKDVPVPLTISIGASQCRVSDAICDAEKLLISADSALYDAKDQGRNRVCHRIISPPSSKAV